MEFQGSLSVYTVLNAALRSADRTKITPFTPYLRLLLEGLGKLPKVSSFLHRGVVADLSDEYSKAVGGKAGRGRERRFVFLISFLIL